MVAIRSLLGLVLATCFCVQVSAVVGPVNINLKSSWDHFYPPRANKANSMNITFRINKDIKFHDTIRIWYPTGESTVGENLKDKICEGLPQLNGELESPRFLPNSKYFEKYPDSKEKTICKLYSLEGTNGAFDWSIEPGNDKKLDDFIGNLFLRDKHGAIKEESGLGWWLMGTVMPALPVDQKERFEKLVMISRRQGAGFHWCYEEGFPGLVNDEKQRSIICRPTSQVESWRNGYNPLTYTTLADAGIISPATPGRYRIAVATTPEPEPVESESFVLPCSKVFDVRCTGFSGSDDDTPPEISFRTGEGGALDAKFSTIIIRFPKNLALTIVPDKTMIKINGLQLLNKPIFSTVDGCLVLTVISPVDIDSMSQARITFDKRFLMGLKPTEKESFVEVKTSSEPEFVRSEPISLVDVGGVSIFPNEEYTPCSLAFSISMPQDKAEGLTKFTICFPEVFSFDKVIDGKAILVEGKPLRKPAKFSNSVLELETVGDLKEKVLVFIDESAKMTSPSSGFYFFKASVDGGKPELFEIFIKPAKPRLNNLKVIKNSNMVVRMEFDFRASSLGSLSAGDWLSLGFPKGFNLSSFIEPEDVTIDKIPAESVRVEGQDLIIGVPKSIPASRMTQIKIKTIIDLSRDITLTDRLVLRSSKNDLVWASFINP